MSVSSHRENLPVCRSEFVLSRGESVCCRGESSAGINLSPAGVNLSSTGVNVPACREADFCLPASGVNMHAEMNCSMNFREFSALAVNLSSAWMNLSACRGESAAFEVSLLPFTPQELSHACPGQSPPWLLVQQCPLSAHRGGSPVTTGQVVTGWLDVAGFGLLPGPGLMPEQTRGAQMCF